MIIIQKVILHTFKRFQHLEVDLDPTMNIFIGDNESGKSTILQAIDLVARGSRTRIENLGIDRLFNVETIKSFMTNINMENLPEMFVELYFNPVLDQGLEGGNNSKRVHNACGIKMICRANQAPAYSREIHRILTQPNAVFPLEYYTVEFYTFSGDPYNGYNKKLNTIMIDNSQIGSPYAMREYVHDIYYGSLNEAARVSTKHAYHDSKNQFEQTVLAQYSAAIAPYTFAVKESSDDNIETDITLTHNNIPIENKGTGLQCFIKTEMSLKRAINDIDSVLIEEPETHLSYMNMLKLIDMIKETENRQLFISTHSDLICTRLNLQKCILFNSTSQTFAQLSALTTETAEFFMKAPDNNMLQFVLSKKVILVEGDAEFILMEALYRNTLQKEMTGSGIGVIAVDGKCFKRYLEIARILHIKVAVITDNDHDYVNNITDNYSDYTQDQFVNIRIYSDTNNEHYTFEVCIYAENQEWLDTLIRPRLRTNTVLGYMTANKAEVAYELLSTKANSIIVPQYIQDAITWIDA